jgi:hypothetical protein
MDDPLLQEPPKSLKQRIQERLAASRYFTFSLLLHVIIVVMGGSVVLFTQMSEPPDFTSDGGGGLVESVSAQPPPDNPEVSEAQEFAPDQPQIAAPTVSAITTTSSIQTNFQMASIPQPVQIVPGDVTKSLTDAAKAIGKGAGSGVPGAMAGRMGGTARMAAMRDRGGKEKSEKAVMAGLRWLKQHQNEDGSWSTEHRPAMTGLAILCFLGHGELPESPEFGPTVKKGVDWLLAKGTEFQGRMSMTRDGWGPNSGVYEHGIATYALGEYYTMTKDERVVELLKQAVGHIVQGQNPRGGWDYNMNKGPRNDLSVAGWMIQALKAAHLTGLNIPGVDEAMDKAMVFLKEWQGPEGGFGYDRPADRWSLTGVGVLCTYFWKEKKDKSVRDGVEYLLSSAGKENPIKYKDPKADLYAWYYHTQACLMYGGSAWSKWNRLFQDEIADNQSPDGSWPPTGQGAHGPQSKPDGAGPYYRTTLCILMLEVFYRYMPVTKG